MIKANFTPTPNILFDKLLKELNNSELKILLIIIRQTHGWIDKNTRRRKEVDRINYSQFIKKTGLSRRILSRSIAALSQKKVIRITDRSGNILNDPNQRKGNPYIYYSPCLEQLQSLHQQTNANNDRKLCNQEQQAVQNRVYNKRNYTKRNCLKETENKPKHIQEIIDCKKNEMG